MHPDRSRMPPPTPEKHSDTSRIFGNILEAIHACNLSSDGKKPAVKWAEVHDYLKANFPSFASWSVAKVRNKYKYLRRIQRRRQ